MSKTPALHEVLNSLYHPHLKKIDPGLERIVHFLHRLGNPHHRLPPVIHVAGTNGKGSLIAYLDSILRAAGKRVHRYISPHLVKFNERIVINGAPIGDDVLLELLRRVQAEAGNHPVTFFEATTAAAFLAFATHEADYVLLETGMGGRLDATNVIARPLLSVITPIGYDHMEFLGETLARIAGEKAGILKPGVPCVVGPQPDEALDVICQVARSLSSPVSAHGHEWHVDEADGGAVYRRGKRRLKFSPSLTGRHQYANAATAIACVDAIPSHGISDDEIVRGIAQAQWPARLQRLTGGKLSNAVSAPGELWLDGGHNAHAATALADWASCRGDGKLVLICGMIETKDTRAFLEPLAPHAGALFALAIPGEETSQPAAQIAAAAVALGVSAHEAGSLQQAVLAAVEAYPGARILICGSLYLAGHALALENPA